MTDKVLKTVEKYKLVEPGDRILVAVSGGQDSMFLLWSLCAIKDGGGNFSLHVAHLNHKLRANASEDANFVRNQATQLNIPCSVGERDVKSYAEAHKLSLEEAAREVRYEFLVAVANKFGMNKLALGHTLSDELETFILRVARGAGGRGLLLIPPKRGIKRISNKELQIIRPLIELRREDIKEFLDRKEIEYCVDASNLNLEYSRNFVRHKVIPVLLELVPDFPSKIMKMRAILCEEDELLDKLADARLKEISLSSGAGLLLDLNGFLETPLPLKRRILRHIYEIQNLKYYPSFDEVENAIRYIENSDGGREFNYRGIKLIKSCKKIKIRNPGDEMCDASKCVELPVPGEVDWAGIKIKSKIKNQIRLRRIKIEFDDTRKVYFDLDKISLPLWVRNRKTGDKIKLKIIPPTAGQKSKMKKLKELFINDKVPVWERDRLPLVADGDGILWVVGVRRAYRALVGKDTKKVLEVGVDKNKINPPQAD